MKLIIVVAVLACARVASAQCVDPTAFGAVGRDDRDDRAALQAAWDAACQIQQGVCIPAGFFDITRKPFGGATGIPSLVLTCPGAGYQTGCLDAEGAPLIGHEFAGAGINRTAIGLMGPSTFPGASQVPAWTMIQPNAINGVCIRDLTVTGHRRGLTSDQTHLIAAQGPVDGLVIERVAAVFPQDPSELGNDTGGDCLRTVGTNAAPVTNVVMRDVVAAPCYRTAVILQRGTFDVLLERVHARAERAKQSLDMEASAGGDIARITVRDSEFVRGPGYDGYTVHFDGVGDGVARPGDRPITDVIFEDVTIEGGGLVLDDVKGVTMIRLKINSGVSASPTYQIQKHHEDVVCIDCTIVRPASAPIGEVIKAFRSEGRTPRDLSLIGGVVRADAQAFLVYGEGLDHLVIDGTHLVYNGPAHASAALKLRGIDALSDPRSVAITFARLQVGGARGLIDVVISPGGTGGPVMLRRNVLVGAGYMSSITGAITSYSENAMVSSGSN